MKLYYGANSPYARKVRVVLAEKELAYEPLLTDVAAAPEDFVRANPNRRVPCLLDGERILFESNVILEYLLQHYPAAGGNAPAPPLAPSLSRPERHWDDLMVLNTIEGVLDSALLLYQFTRDGVAPEQASQLQREQRRVQSGLDWLEQRATPEGFQPGVFSIQDLNFTITGLWLDFRKPAPWRGRPRLEALVSRYEGRPSLQATRPVG